MMAPYSQLLLFSHIFIAIVGTLAAGFNTTGPTLDYHKDSSPLSCERTQKFENTSIAILSIVIASLIALRVAEAWRDKDLSFVQRLHNLRSSRFLVVKIMAGVSAAAPALLRIVFDCTDTCTDSNLDSDIGGVGVLIGVYIPILLTTLSLIGGRWPNICSGTKEAALIVQLSKI